MQPWAAAFIDKADMGVRITWWPCWCGVPDIPIFSYLKKVPEPYEREDACQSLLLPARWRSMCLIVMLLIWSHIASDSHRLPVKQAQHSWFKTFILIILPTTPFDAVYPSSTFCLAYETLSGKIVQGLLEWHSKFWEVRKPNGNSGSGEYVMECFAFMQHKLQQSSRRLQAATLYLSHVVSFMAAVPDR